MRDLPAFNLSFLSVRLGREHPPYISFPLYACCVLFPLMFHSVIVTSPIYRTCSFILQTQPKFRRCNVLFSGNSRYLILDYLFPLQTQPVSLGIGNSGVDSGDRLRRDHNLTSARSFPPNISQGVSNMLDSSFESFNVLL